MQVTLEIPNKLCDTELILTKAVFWCFIISNNLPRCRHPHDAKLIFETKNQSHSDSCTLFPGRGKNENWDSAKGDFPTV